MKQHRNNEYLKLLLSYKKRVKRRFVWQLRMLHF